jgi:hypothetical protein
MTHLPETVTAVTVAEPVDGTSSRKPPSRGSRTNRRRAVDTTLSLDSVHPLLREAALRARRPNERIVVVSPTEVRLQ